MIHWSTGLPAVVFCLAGLQTGWSVLSTPPGFAMLQSLDQRVNSHLIWVTRTVVHVYSALVFDFICYCSPRQSSHWSTGNGSRALLHCENLGTRILRMVLGFDGAEKGSDSIIGNYQLPRQIVRLEESSTVYRGITVLTSTDSLIFIIQ